jgi:hypothetical protein
MKLGALMVDAKLTETDFQTAPARLIERFGQAQLSVLKCKRKGSSRPGRTSSHVRPR